MITVQKAEELIKKNPWVPAFERIPFGDTLNRVLAVDVIPDRDLPPYDRVAMDGIAILQSDFISGITRFRITGVAAAGQPEMVHGGPGTCTEVMTGAVLPRGSDAVIRYEDVRLEDGHATVLTDRISPGMNVHPKGNDITRNHVLLPSGTLVSAAEVPILASVGCMEVSVKSLPRTAIITTGDELVEPEAIPLPHQIRQSNRWAIRAALQPLSVPCSYHHFGDHELDPVSRMNGILHQSDLLILSGGVSKGKFDWVPGVLERCGISCHFHSVAQRPGKPLWFGSGDGKVVFALPGNPVSVFLCLYRYVVPWLRESLGMKNFFSEVVLDRDFNSDLPLTHFLQVKVERQGQILWAQPVPGGGSGDFVNLRHADGFIELPASSGKLKKGMLFPYIPFRS